MILLTILLLIIIILIMAMVAIVSSIGAVGILVFGDVIVCIGLLTLWIIFIIKRKRKKRGEF